MPVTLSTAEPANPPLARTGARRFGLKSGLFVVVAVTALLWSFRFSGPIDLRYDAGVYYVLGTSLAEGKGYRLINEPGSPQAIQYPPALPAFVALHQRLLGTSDPVVVGVWLKRSFAVMHLLLAIGTFLVARKMLGERAGLIAALLSLAQLNNYYLSNLLFTELPYTLVSVCLAWVLMSDRMQRRPAVRESLGFLLVTLGFFLRTAGVALLAAWVVEALFRRNWRWAAARAVLGLVPFLAWQTYVGSVRHSDGYSHPSYAYQRAAYQFYNVSYAENLALEDPFRPELGRANVGAWLARIGANLARLPLSLAEGASEVQGMWSAPVKTIFYPGQKKVEWLDRAAVVPLVAVTLVLLLGIAQSFRRRDWFSASLITFSIGLTCMTPWPGQFSRYLAPIAPFLAVMLVLGATQSGELLRRIRPPFIRRMSYALAGFVLVGFLSAHAYALLNSFRSMSRTPPASIAGDQWSDRKWFYYDLAWSDWDKAIDWINHNAPSDAVVATAAPHLCFLMTGRQAVFPPMEPNIARAREFLASVPISYVVIDDFDFLDITRRYASPVMNAADGGWKQVQRFNHTSLYERVNQRPLGN